MAAMPIWLQRIGGIGAVVGVLMSLAGLIALESVLYSIGGIILLILGLGLFWYGWRLRHVDDSDVARLMRELERLQQRKSYLETQLDAPLPVASDVPNLERQLLSNVTMMKVNNYRLIMKKPWLNGKHGFLKGLPRVSMKMISLV